jgi:PAS domain S-box-containing protein
MTQVSFHKETFKYFCDMNTTSKLSESALRLVVESLPVALLIVNKEGKIIYLNKLTVDLFGYNKKELTGKTIEVLIPPGFKESHPELRTMFHSSSKPRHMGSGRELFAMRHDGTEFNAEVGLSQLVTTEGLFVLVSIIDITERKEAEAKLNKTNRLYSFVSQMKQSIIRIKDEQVLLEKVCEISHNFGKFKMTWVGLFDEKQKSISLLNQCGMKEEDIALFSKNIIQTNGPQAHILNTGNYYVCNNIAEDFKFDYWKTFAAAKGIRSLIMLPIKKSGKIIGTFNLYSDKIHFFDEDVTGLLSEAITNLSFALDNFEKENIKNTFEKNLKHSELRMRDAQEIAHLGSWELNFETGIALWSEESCRIYGLSPEDNKHSYQVWLSYIHPDDMEYILKLKEESQKTFSDAVMFHRIVLKDGTIKHLNSISKFEFDKDGIPIGMYGIAHDITESKNAEDRLKLNNAELQKTNAELDRFVYSISHELRSPLTSIMGLQPLMQVQNLNEENKGILNFINRSVFKMDETLREILDYSRNSRNEINFEKIDMKKIIDEAFENSNYYKEGFSFDKRININADVPFYSDLTRVKIIINNLVANSLKYGKKDIPDAFIEFNITVDDDKMSLEISDNGIGIEEEYLHKIFKMFYRATVVNSGSGLGLYIVKECIEKLNGAISVESESGHGSQFRIEIPNKKPINKYYDKALLLQDSIVD